MDYYQNYGNHKLNVIRGGDINSILKSHVNEIIDSFIVPVITELECCLNDIYRINTKGRNKYQAGYLNEMIRLFENYYEEINDYVTKYLSINQKEHISLIIENRVKNINSDNFQEIFEKEIWPFCAVIINGYTLMINNLTDYTNKNKIPSYKIKFNKDMERNETDLTCIESTNKSEKCCDLSTNASNCIEMSGIYRINRLRLILNDMIKFFENNNQEKNLKYMNNKLTTVNGLINLYIKIQKDNNTRNTSLAKKGFISRIFGTGFGDIEFSPRMDPRSTTTIPIIPTNSAFIFPKTIKAVTTPITKIATNSTTTTPAATTKVTTNLPATTKTVTNSPATTKAATNSATTTPTATIKEVTNSARTTSVVTNSQNNIPSPPQMTGPKPGSTGPTGPPPPPPPKFGLLPIQQEPSQTEIDKDKIQEKLNYDADPWEYKITKLDNRTYKSLYNIISKLIAPEGKLDETQKNLLNMSKYFSTTDVSNKILIFDKNIKESDILKNKDFQKNLYYDYIQKLISDCAKENYGLKIVKSNVGGTGFAYPSLAVYEEGENVGLYFIKIFIESLSKEINRVLKPYQKPIRELNIFDIINRKGDPINKLHLLKGKMAKTSTNSDSCKKIHFGKIIVNNNETNITNFIDANCTYNMHDYLVNIISNDVYSSINEIKKVKTGIYTIKINSSEKFYTLREFRIIAEPNMLNRRAIIAKKFIKFIDTKNSVRNVKINDSDNQSRNYNGNPFNDDRIKDLTKNEKLEEGNVDIEITIKKEKADYIDSALNNIKDWDLIYGSQSIGGSSYVVYKLVNPLHQKYQGKIELNRKIQALQLSMEDTKKLRFCYEKDILKEDYNVKFLLQEFMTGGSICDTLSNMSDDELIDMLIQLLFQLYYFHKVIHLHHGDLHVNNVMNTNDANYDENKKKYYKYQYKDVDNNIKYIYIPVRERIYKIIDFDKSFDLETDTQLVRELYDRITYIKNMASKLSVEEMKKNIIFNDYSANNVKKAITDYLANIFNEIIKKMNESIDIISKQDFLSPDKVDNFYKYNGYVNKINKNYENLVEQKITSTGIIPEEERDNIINKIHEIDDLSQINRIIELNKINNSLETIKNNINTYSIFHMEKIIQTQGDFIFLLKSMYQSVRHIPPIYLDNKEKNTLLNREDIPKENLKITVENNIRNVYDKFRDEKLTMEQYCKNVGDKSIYKIIGGMINVASSIGTLSQAKDIGQIKTRFKLTSDGQLAEENRKLKNGELNSFMYLINDYIQEKNLFNEPTDGEIIEAINVSNIE